MDNPLFDDEVLSFIESNKKIDVYKLLLQKSPFPNVSIQSLAQQIQGKKIAEKKFPFLLKSKQYIFPPKVSLEQASSEQTAEYKAKLMNGDSFVDLTGGMGIDCFLLGRQFSNCVYVEPNEDLYKSTMHNFKQLEYVQCEGMKMTAEEFLKKNNKNFDWVYIDPSRRVGGNRKTSIENYEPNIVKLKEQLISTGKNAMIKLSPMQDISECITVLKNVEKVWIISIKNDVKELLLKLGHAEVDDPEIEVVDLEMKINFKADYFSRITQIDKSNTKKYIYQPNAALVKSELHNKYSKELKLKKLHANTQLYTSDECVKSYFGRVFEVITLMSSSKKEVSKLLPNKKANVIAKNYPLSPDQLITKLKIKEGGDKYILAFTDSSNKKVLALCRRL